MRGAALPEPRRDCRESLIGRNATGIAIAIASQPPPPHYSHFLPIAKVYILTLRATDRFVFFWNLTGKYRQTTDPRSPLYGMSVVRNFFYTTQV